MLAAAWLYWPTPEVAFRTDESPVAWLSSAQLWGLALLATRLWRDSPLPRGLCLWLAAAMAGLAFDEQFMLHEQWKYSCTAWTGLCRFEWGRELPMYLVAGLGIVTGVLLGRHVPKGALRRLLASAVTVGIFALYLRFTQRPIDLLPYKAALLVISEALFAGVLLGLPTTRQVHSP